MLHIARVRTRFVVAVCAVMLALLGAPARSAEVTYALRIENGHVAQNMQLIRVKQDDVVKLQWTADKRSVVHLHGYDIEKTVLPGAVTDLTFTARATGRFQVHLHG